MSGIQRPKSLKGAAMEKLLELMTSYPELSRCLLDIVTLLVVTSLFCLYLVRAGRLWIRVLEVVIKTCGGVLYKIRLGHPTFLELKIIEGLELAMDQWHVAKTLDSIGTKTIDLYLEGKECHLSIIEGVYTIGKHLEKESPVNMPFDVISSAMWRYNWLHSRVSLLAAFYMEVSRLFSIRKRTVLWLYAKIRKDIKSGLHEKDRDNNDRVSSM